MCSNLAQMLIVVTLLVVAVSLPPKTAPKISGSISCCSAGVWHETPELRILLAVPNVGETVKCSSTVVRALLPKARTACYGCIRFFPTTPNKCCIDRAVLISLAHLPEASRACCGCQCAVLTSPPWPVITCSAVHVAKSHTWSPHENTSHSVRESRRSAFWCRRHCARKKSFNQTPGPEGEGVFYSELSGCTVPWLRINSRSITSSPQTLQAAHLDGGVLGGCGEFEVAVRKGDGADALPVPRLLLHQFQIGLPVPEAALQQN